MEKKREIFHAGIITEIFSDVFSLENKEKFFHAGIITEIFSDVFSLENKGEIFHAGIITEILFPLVMFSVWKTRGKNRRVPSPENMEDGERHDIIAWPKIASQTRQCAAVR